MSPKKIVVFPAGGMQGRNICQTLSKDKNYEVVGIVRNLDSAKNIGSGIDLKQLDIKLVQGDFADVDSYKQHFEGADAVFFNTDFWSILPTCGYDAALARKTELQYATNVVEECKKAGVGHVICSSLFNAVSTPPDDHIASGLDVSEMISKSGVPYTIFLNCGYWDNIELFNLLQPQEDGSFKLNLFCPDETYQVFATPRVTGLYVEAIIENSDKYLGKQVMNKSEWASWGSMASRLSTLSGKKVITPNFSDEQWNSEAIKQAVGPFWATMNMIYTSSIDVTMQGTTGKDVVDQTPTFEEWARSTPYIQNLLGLE